MVTRAERIIASTSGSKRVTQIISALLDLVDLIAEVFSYRYPAICAVVRHGVLLANAPVNYDDSAEDPRIALRISTLSHKIAIASNHEDFSGLNKELYELNNLLKNRSVKKNADEEAN